MQERERVESLALAGITAKLKPAVDWNVAITRVDNNKLELKERRRIFISDGEKWTEWNVEQLTSLFRGDRKPPANLQQYPPDYVPYFYYLENHLLLFCEEVGDRTDQEMEDTYGALRRRPDGRSLGPTHDFMWQVSAGLLGQYPISAAEYEGIMDALLGSVRRWSLRPVSRFYVDYLKQTL